MARRRGALAPSNPSPPLVALSATCSAVSSLALRLARLQVVPSGSPDRCAAPPPEKLTAVATAFLPASFSPPRCYTAHTPPDRPAGYPAGQYRAPRDALQNNLPRSPCHFQYIPASPGYIYPPSAAARQRPDPHQRLQAIAQRGEIYPRPIALNDTPLLQALHPLGGARRGQPHSRAQDLERNSGILSQAERIALSISSSTSFIYFT